MKTIGLFEAKTKFSEICDQVSKSGEAVTVTRRGQPLVRIDPLHEEGKTIRERRAEYLAGPGRDDLDDKVDFDPPPRSAESDAFELPE